MKIFNRIGLLTLLLVGAFLHSAAQNSSLHVANSTSLFIKSGTPVSADGLVLIPDADYILTGPNTLLRTSSVAHPSPEVFIQRVFRFTTTLPAFSGSVGLRFTDGELNNLTKNSLVLKIHDGSSWNTFSNVTRTENGNLVMADNLSGIGLDEVTLSATSITPVLSLNPASFCSADNGSYALGATPTGGSWSGNGVVENADGTYSFRPSIAGPGNHQLSYTLPGETGSASLMANVAGSPNEYSVTGGGAYCSGGAGAPIGLEASDAGLVYQLVHSSAGVMATQTGTGGALSFGSFTQPGVYYVTTISNGCARTMEGGATVIVSPAATGSITASGSTSFCPGGSVILTANEASSYLWSTGATTRAITVSDAGSYSVSVTNEAGCSASSSPVNVVVEDNEAPRIENCPRPGGDASAIMRPATATACTYTITGDEFDIAASDNCNGALSYGYALSGATTLQSGARSLSGIVLNPGETVITWSIADASGNKTSCSFSVLVQDKTAPLTPVLPKLSAECSITATVPTTSDACAGPINGTTSDPLTYNKQGTYTIRWTFADGNGNQVTVNQEVEVKDVTAPVPDVAVLPAVKGECSATVTAPTASDNCGATITATTSDPLTYTTQGEHTITWTYDDGNGNSTSQTQKVVIDDVSGPEFVAPASRFVALSSNCSIVIPNLINGLTGTDNCGTVTFSQQIAAGTLVSLAHGGSVEVSITANDGHGNTTVKTVSLTAVDQTAPFLKTGFLLNRTVECHLVPSPPTVSAGDNCDPAPVVTLSEVSTQGSDPNAASYYNYTLTRTWTATDNAGNSALIGTQVITVQDKIPPAISYSLPLPRGVTPGKCGADVFILKARANDNCGPVTITNSFNGTDDASGFYPVGTTKVTWTATDASGNETVVSFDVTVVDNISPVVTAPANLSISTDAGSCVATGVQLGVPEAFDDCGIKTIINNAPETYPVGTTRIVWVVIAHSGSSTTVYQDVTVTDNEKPVITAPAAISTGNDAGKCSASGVDLGSPVTSDNCTVASVTNNAPAIFPAGTTVVTWTVTDAAGNTSTATQNVVVNDVEKPIITAPADVTLDTDAGKCTASGFNLGTPQTSDNCDIATVSHNAPAQLAPGTYTITWTVTDAAGNSATATQRVTVADTEKPKITAPAKVSVINDAGECFASHVLLGSPVASDNCTLLSVTNNAPATYPVGTSFVTWYATDIYGNVSTAVQTVVVTDTEKPVVNCPSVPASYCYNTGGYVVPQLTATDNCAVNAVSYTITGATNRTGLGYDPGTQFNIGTSVITWTVKDVSGNVSTCQANVVVIDPMVVAIPDAKALPAGVAPNTVYIGYSPAAAITLTADVSGGSGNYQFQWSNGATTQSITVSPSMATTYSVTVTDDKGCSKTASQLVNVVDVRCGNNLDKVLVCHIPDGNASKLHNICVSPSAVATHLAEGDYLGVCGGQITQPVITDVKLVEFTIDALPNPTITYFTLKLNSTSDLPIKLRVTDMWGRVLETRDNLTPGSTIELGSRYRAGAYFVEVIQGLEWRHVKLIKTAN